MYTGHSCDLYPDCGAPGSAAPPCVRLQAAVADQAGVPQHGGGCLRAHLHDGVRVVVQEAAGVAKLAAARLEAADSSVRREAL